jgi:hypothetical protein
MAQDERRDFKKIENFPFMLRLSKHSESFFNDLLGGAMARNYLRYSMTVLALAFYFALPRTAQGAAEDLLAELNAKAPEQRQKILVENAR